MVISAPGGLSSVAGPITVLEKIFPTSVKTFFDKGEPGGLSSTAGKHGRCGGSTVGANKGCSEGGNETCTHSEGICSHS